MAMDNSSVLSEIDKARLKLSIEHYIKYFIGKRTCEISKEEAFKVISMAVREFAMDRMYQTIARYNKANSKRVYYLSIEYLIGRSLENNLRNLGLFSSNVTDLSPLAEAKLLETFCFNGPAIPDFSPLSALPRLNTVLVPQSMTAAAEAACPGRVSLLG